MTSSSIEQRESVHGLLDFGSGLSGVTQRQEAGDRITASWLTFLDALGVDYDDARSSSLTNTGAVAPDFYLSELGFWLVIHRDRRPPQGTCLVAYKELASKLKDNLLVSDGAPGRPSLTWIDRTGEVIGGESECYEQFMFCGDNECSDALYLVGYDNNDERTGHYPLNEMCSETTLPHASYEPTASAYRKARRHFSD